MHVVWMVVIGLVVGAGVRLLFPRRNSLSIVFALLLGVTGSIFGGSIGVALGWFQGAWEVSGVITSVVGAMLLILLFPIIGDLLRTRDR